MKIIIRYYSQWGNMSTKPCTVNPNIKVAQLKQQIAQITGINAQDQILILGDDTLEDDRHLFNYHPEECQFIYVNRNQQVEEDAAESPQETVPQDLQNKRYFEKLGIVQEDSEEEIDNKKKSIGAKPQMEIASEFIKLVKANDILAVKAMISNHKSSTFDLINDRQFCGFSGFHYANQCGHEDLVEYLLEQGADVNLCTKDRQSPLQLSLKNSKVECAKLLLAKPVCDVNYAIGKTALQLAVQKGELEIVELILKHKQFDPQSVEMEEIKGDTQAAQLVMYHCQKQNKIVEPPKPQAQKGYIKKVNVMKFFHYKRYLTLDPEAGNLTRYKTEQDCPLNPIEVVPLENVISVGYPKREWFMKSDHEYLTVSYKKSGIEILLFCSKSKTTIQSWKQSLEDCIKFYLEHDKLIKQQTIIGDLSALNQLIGSCGGQFSEIADSRCQSLNNEAVAAELKKEAEQIVEPVSPQKQRTLSPPVLEISNGIQHKQYLINYTIIKQIGQGAFGKVFLVKYKPTQQVLAMKQLNKRKLLQKKQIKFAVTECEILKQVDSPYIVNLFQSFQTLNNLYLVMDYCGGGDLSFHLYKHRTFTEATCKIIIRQVMKAVQYLHGKGIIYRDLKPENVLIDNDGHIKLVDFGLSKQAENGKAKTFCGSPAYLAPEVLGQKGAVQATDVYGIGTVLYELLTGEPPYFNEDLETLYNNIRNDNLTVPNKLSKPCQSILHGLLQKEANKRIGCKFPSQVNWDLIQQHEWLEWECKEEKVTFGLTQENLASVCKNYVHNLGDVDYQEDNYNLNRITGWTFARV